MKRFMISCIALACVVSGCGSSKDAGPTPVTSTMGTPSPGGSSASASATSATGETPSSTLASATDSPTEDDFSDATKVFQAFEEAINQAQAQGGSAVLPVSMRDLAAPPVTVETQQQLAKQRVDDWRLGAPLPTVTHVMRLEDQRQGSTVALQACVDGTQTPVLLHGRGIGKAEAYSYRAYFKPVEGHLKLFLLQHKQVSQCA